MLENSGLNPSRMVCAAGGSAASTLALNKAINNAIAEPSPSFKFGHNFFINDISDLCLNYS